jgi:hypothetical protein
VHPSGLPTGTVYGRGGAPVSGREPEPGLLSRLHPAITAGIAVSVIAVLTLGYLVWRSSITTQPPVAAGPATTPAAAPPATESPVASPSPSPSASSTGPALTPGTWFLESVDYSGRYVRRKDGLGVVETINAATDEKARQEAALIVTNGLADRSCFTFRTTDGRYLRHYAFRLRFAKPDDSDLFLKDATFCAEAGTEANTVRLRSFNYPDRTIHHRDAELWLDKTDDSPGFLAASSFTTHLQPNA